MCGGNVHLVFAPKNKLGRSSFNLITSTELNANEPIPFYFFLFKKSVEVSDPEWCRPTAFASVNANSHNASVLQYRT